MTDQRNSFIDSLLGLVVAVPIAAFALLLALAFMLEVGSSVVRHYTRPAPLFVHGDTVVVTDGFYRGKHGRAVSSYRSASGIWKIAVALEGVPIDVTISEDDLAADVLPIADEE